jgi:hypothetical protein
MTRVKKTYRSLNVRSSPKKKDFQSRELLLTIGNGDVLKIEKVAKSGRRREVTDAEFSKLAGNGTAELGAALEHAYTLGFADAVKDELSEDEEGVQEQDAKETIRRFVLRRAAGLRRLRSSARKLILGRALGGRKIQPKKAPKHGA